MLTLMNLLFIVALVLTVLSTFDFFRNATKGPEIDDISGKAPYIHEPKWSLLGAYGFGLALAHGMFQVVLSSHKFEGTQGVWFGREDPWIQVVLILDIVMLGWGSFVLLMHKYSFEPQKKRAYQLYWANKRREDEERANKVVQEISMKAQKDYEVHSAQFTLLRQTLEMITQWLKTAEDIAPIQEGSEMEARFTNLQKQLDGINERVMEVNLFDVIVFGAEVIRFREALATSEGSSRLDELPPPS